MAASPPSLPTNRAFLVQFRAQPSETPMAWEGRVEHMVSGQVTHFHTLEALLAFMCRVLTDGPPPTWLPVSPPGAAAGGR